jgi:hypothetical protein
MYLSIVMVLKPPDDSGDSNQHSDILIFRTEPFPEISTVSQLQNSAIVGSIADSYARTATAFLRLIRGDELAR